jgi:hypothetical protein
VSTAVLTPPSTDEAFGFLSRTLDLSGVRAKLADSEEGKGYGPERLDLLETEYRKFLALQLAYPGQDIVPCMIVDEIWHQHILDTIAYRADCDAIFGRFLDHFPYFGMRGPEDAEALADAYSMTLDRYVESFGTPPEGTWISADAAKCSRTNCKPTKCR